jgi:antitoxin (DNA-binding transcriptional repressor) of toxin-antitoxin stability system
VVYLTEHGQRIAAIVPAEYAAALETARRIREIAEAFRDEPRPSGAVMLTGPHGVLRVRIGD